MRKCVRVWHIVQSQRLVLEMLQSSGSCRFVCLTMEGEVGTGVEGLFEFWSDLTVARLAG